MFVACTEHVHGAPTTTMVLTLVAASVAFSQCFVVPSSMFPPPHDLPLSDRWKHRQRHHCACDPRFLRLPLAWLRAVPYGPGGMTLPRETQLDL